MSILAGLDIGADIKLFEGPDDLDNLSAKIGSKRHVFLGEATHGTSEFYAWRARISQKLIQEKKFNFVAVEGDWTDCFKINRYIKDINSPHASAEEVLRTFDRWPTWMWANKEMVEFIEWLKRHNQNLPENEKVGFYGLDVYSLWDSLNEVIKFLRANLPEHAQRAEEAYKCFEVYDYDEQKYAQGSAFVPKTCESDLLKLLIKIKTDLARLNDKNRHREEVFAAEQNMLVASNAERYYRTMFKGSAASWNIRDLHMHETLTRLLKFYGEQSKSIVWAHNTHIGDSRYTDMKDAGMINIGQLARDSFTEEEVFLLGFSTYQGSVVAGSYWGSPTQIKSLPAAQEGSFEHLMNQQGVESGVIFMDEVIDDSVLWENIDHRAVGVVYDPEDEKRGNYVPTLIPKRYDGMVFISETRALHPLKIDKLNDRKLPETYPWGI